MRGWEAYLGLLLLVGSLALVPGAQAGTSVDVAVLDSGINPNHDAFCPGQVEVWMDLVNGNDTPYDDRGHGTATASRVGGQDPDGDGEAPTLGAFPCVDLHVYKVSDANGSSDSGTINDAIYHAVENGAEVISLSLSGSFPFPPASIARSGAVDYATDHGVLVVSSAGNDGRIPVDDPREPPDAFDAAGHGPSELYHGRNSADALIVGASDANGSRAEFSQRNPEVLAHGADVWIADHEDLDGAEKGWGTSYSTPWVAGSAARLLDAGAPNDVGWLKWVLLHVADDDLLVPYADEGYGVLEDPEIDQALQIAKGLAPVPFPDHRDVPHLASLGLRTVVTTDLPVGVLHPSMPELLDPLR